MTRQVSSVRQQRNAEVLQQRRLAGKAIAPNAWFGYHSGYQDPIELAELTTKARKKLPKSVFAIPEKRAYPIHDESHARNALARVSQHGTPEEKSRVRAAVARRFPNIGKKGGKSK